jgi:hypothetical protein
MGIFLELKWEFQNFKKFKIDKVQSQQNVEL